VAGALWGASFMEPADEVPSWLEIGREEFRRLARDPASGVRIAPGILASRWTEGPPPPFVFPGAQFERRPAPPGFLDAYRTLVPVIDMPRYLDYLVGRLGLEIELRRLGSLAEVDAAVIVNCCGTGARDLVPDPAMRALRGQHVVVENPGIEEFFVEEQRESEWVGYFPHGPRVVLGGVAADDDWSLEPDPAVARAIVERCASVEPRLRDARVIEHQVGLRPARGGVRLEEESIGGVRCIHNYGHGGSGVSLSWGSARAVARIIGR
jgi:D-amino-acid oxidase